MLLRELLHIFKLGLFVVIPLVLAILFIVGAELLVHGAGAVILIVAFVILITLVIGIGVSVLTE